MNDVIDRAQAAEETERDLALAFVPAPRSGKSAPDCRVCGAPIPEARRQAVVTELCIRCARAAERGKR